LGNAHFFSRSAEVERLGNSTKIAKMAEFQSTRSLGGNPLCSTMKARAERKEN